MNAPHSPSPLATLGMAPKDLVGELRSHMSRAAKLAVPLKVDVGIGLNWDEAH
jgi:DNA polymerase I-like protein with 3'-5' exonuclease and polymerase domains